MGECGRAMDDAVRYGLSVVAAETLVAFSAVAAEMAGVGWVFGREPPETRVCYRGPRPSKKNAIPDNIPDNRKFRLLLRQ